MFKKKISIKYFNEKITKLKKIKEGDWIDLRCNGVNKIVINNTIDYNNPNFTKPLLKRENLKSPLAIENGTIYNEDKKQYEDVEFIKYSKGDFLMIDLGIAMQLPKGYEANVVPRSSTFKNFTLIQTNSFGVIDFLYRGDNDRWFMPVLAMQDGFIIIDERICQFRINKKMPNLLFKIKELFNAKDRGGHGKSGTK